METQGDQSRNAPFKGNDAYRAAEILTRVTANPTFRSEYLQSPVEVVEREFCKKLTPEQKKAVEDTARLIKGLYPKGHEDKGDGNLD